jgi:D-inositol-3-phosphate glycosyltransferase
MIRKEKPDLLIFRYWMPFMAPCQGVIAKMVKKNRKTRIVAVADNIIPHEKFPLGKWLTRFFVRSCDGFVTMSEKVMLDLKAIRPEAPARFIPHPLYDNFGEAVFRKEALKELGLDPEYRYVLFFGFIRKYKGLDLLLDAFADANLQKQKIRLLVAGEFYEDSTPYLNRMKEPDLAGRVICYNDFIPDNRVKYFFSACDIVAQTYRAATQSGVTQVAYQFFKPVLVTDVGGLSEMVPHGKVGYVVPPQTADISSALLRFFSENNPEAFRDGILEERKKFSWENLVNSLLGI